MKVYVETNPETIYSGRVKDEVKTTEIRMWFETDEEIEVLSLADYTKQVRKEVYDEIRKWCNRNFNWVGGGTSYDGQDYNEMIGSNNTINKPRSDILAMENYLSLLKKQSQQIADLEAKLAEKDAELEKWSTQYARAYINRQNDLIAKNNQLKQQLEEKEKEQNQKAIKELEKLKETLIPLRNLEIEAIRETNEYEFNSLEARKYWVANHKESSKTYNNMIKKIYNQINGLKEMK